MDPPQTGEVRIKVNTNISLRGYGYKCMVAMILEEQAYFIKQNKDLFPTMYNYMYITIFISEIIAFLISLAQDIITEMSLNV